LDGKSFRRVGSERDIRVDVRVVAATNEDPEIIVREKHFRADLFYRLDVFRIHLPPLRERPGGVTVLTNYFLAQFNALYGKNLRAVSPEAYRALRRYSWPGNVRELKNVVQRAVVIAKHGELMLDLLPTRIQECIGETEKAAATNDASRIAPGMTLDAVEKNLIELTLASTQGNKKLAASLLGISRRALYDKLKKYQLT
jgi:transcriptional regulator with PAS, ATPase and Fis domain